MSQTPYTGASVNTAKTNTLAIVAIIGAFIIPIVGIVVGIISLRQIRVTGERGHGLALAGVILGIAFVILYVLIGIISAVAGAAMSSGY